jgi:hypothetical protein
MELVVHPPHPVAIDVGSSRSRCLAPEIVPTLAVDDDHGACATAINEHHYDSACARCLIAAGHAVDVTARHYAPSGRLHDGSPGDRALLRAGRLSLHRIRARIGR